MHNRPSGKSRFIITVYTVLAWAVAATAMADTTPLARGYALEGGLTSLVATRIDGRRAVLGKFELDGQVAYFETRRGARVRHREPGDPKYELDVCFKNAAGEQLMLQLGGDAALIPGCDAGGESDAARAGSTEARSVDDVRADFLSASKAIDALKAVRFKKAFVHEYDALVGHAVVAEEGVNGKVMHPGTIEIDDPDESATATDANVDARNHCCPGRYQHYMDVYSAPVAGTFGHATHAATAAYRILHGTGYFDLAWHRCNHGRCFWAIGGYWWCSMWTSHANRGHHVHNQPCQTFYSPFSTVGGHNCNDDMVMEYGSIRDNVHYSGYGGTCADPFRRDYTPPCW